MESFGCKCFFFRARALADGFVAPCAPCCAPCAPVVFTSRILLLDTPAPQAECGASTRRGIESCVIVHPVSSQPFPSNPSHPTPALTNPSPTQTPAPSNPNPTPTHRTTLTPTQLNPTPPHRDPTPPNPTQPQHVWPLPLRRSPSRHLLERLSPSPFRKFWILSKSRKSSLKMRAESSSCCWEKKLWTSIARCNLSASASMGRAGRGA